MIPSSSGRGWVESKSEGQIALSLLLPLSLSLISLALFITSHFSFPLWHVSVYSPLRVSPSAFITPFPSTSFPLLSVLLCHLHTLLFFFFFSLPFYSLGLHIGLDTQTRAESCAKTHTHLSWLPSVPQVITSQTHPHKHHINLSFKLTPQNAQRHKNMYGLHMLAGWIRYAAPHQMGLRNHSRW